MKYFLDTEFIEGFKESLFSKRRHFIDLISIGIVAEDGREYYAISNEFNYYDASPWVRKNVISKLEGPLGHMGMEAVREIGIPNKQIAAEIYRFVTETIRPAKLRNINQIEYHLKLEYGPADLPLFDFYAYYADYDWVLFCSLFGTMNDLPFGFPMYCRDLKQMIDEKAETLVKTRGLKGETVQGILERLKERSDYPKQENEHSALDDAKWNKKLYEFIRQV